MIRSVKLSILIFVGTYSLAQNIQLDGRAIGVGNISSVLSNNTSILANPGTTNLVNHKIFLGYSSSIHPDLRDVSAGYYARVGKIGLTTSITRFGNSFLNYHQMSLSASHKLGIATLGVRTNYHQLFIDGYGSKSIISFDIGGLAELGKNIKIGSFVRNISNSGFAKEQLDYLPTSFITGVHYKSSERLTILAELEQLLAAEHLNVKVGLEYLVHRHIEIRTGINTFPSTNNFGVGFSFRNAQLDIGLANHQFLGISQTTSLSIALQ